MSGLTTTVERSSRLANLPLTGLRIIALEHMIAMPFGTQVLSDLGAEVVDVEQKDHAKYDAWAPWRVRTGRHKQRIVVDLSDREGQALIRRLARAADVLVENYRPGVMDKYGLGYRQLAADNPRLIYVSVSGFGHEDILPSPSSSAAGYGAIAESYGGLTAALMHRGATGTSGTALADIVSGLYAMIGLLAALRERDKTGKGQYVDVALVDSVFTLAELPFILMTLQMAGSPPSPNAGGALDGVFRVSDGHFNLVVLTRRHWETLARVIDHPEWTERPWFTDPRLRTAVLQSEIMPQIQEWAKGQSLHEVMTRLRGEGLAVSPVNEPHMILADTHYHARNMILTLELPDGSLVRVPGSPIKLSSVSNGGASSAQPIRIPRPGEHTFEVLRKWLNIGDDELTSLTEAAVIEQVP